MAKRYQRGKLEDVIKEWLIIQWSKDTKGETRESLIIQWPKDTKGEIRRRNQRMTNNTMVKRYQRGNKKT